MMSFKDPDYAKALSFLDRRNDSAFYFFNKVASAAKDSLQTASAYNYMAQIQSDVGDYFGGQESLSLALRFLAPGNKKNFQCLTSTYNELGLTSIRLKNLGTAVNYFDQAAKFSNDSGYQLILLNNKALAYQDKKAYLPALTIYKDIIKRKSNPETYARILNNFATTKWLNDPNYNAAPELRKALKIRLQQNDRWGLNSSYIHLGDFYARSHPDSALYFAVKLYHSARELHSPDDELDALSKLIRLAPLSETKSYFTHYKQLEDSLQTARNADKNQFALIRYEAEKNKADNLRLQKDNTEKKYELIKKNVLLYSTLGLSAALAAAAWLWYRKRKRRMEFESRQRELQLSQKVHDEVANGLYRIMKQIEHGEGSNREVLLDEMEALYEQSRDISYERVNTQANFDEKVDKLLAGLAGDEINVTVAGNNAVLWEKVNATMRRHLLYILQELMVNMRKHSEATGVTLSFKLVENQLHIQYTDNGKGFPQKIQFGNGLRHTVSRMEGMGGTITFDPLAEKGAKVLIALAI